MGPEPQARPDMKCKWGIEDVNREMPASQSDTVINSISVLSATGRKNKRHGDKEYVTEVNPDLLY